MEPSEVAITPSEALMMACQDASLLVSPQARQRGLDALTEDESVEAQAAVVILLDGGAWQGLPGFNAYRHTFEDWLRAVKTLKSWWRTQTEYKMDHLDRWAEK